MNSPNAPRRFGLQPDKGYPPNDFTEGKGFMEPYSIVNDRIWAPLSAPSNLNQASLNQMEEQPVWQIPQRSPSKESAFSVSQLSQSSCQAPPGVAEETEIVAASPQQVQVANQMVHQLQTASKIDDRMSAAAFFEQLIHFKGLPASTRMEVCSALGGALSDRHYAVRARAACALGQLGEAAACHVPELVALFGDSRPVARAAAAFAVGKLACNRPSFAATDAAALGALLQDKHANVREAAVTAIGAIGLPDANLARGLAFLVLSDKYATIRAAAASSLGKQGDEVKKHADALAAMIKDENMKVRTAVLHALGKCGEATQPHLAKILDALSDEQHVVRAAAANTLGNLAASAFIKKRLLGSVGTLLAPALQDENGDVRAAAAFALGKFHEAAAPHVAALERLQDDPKAKVRKAATYALERLSDRGYTVPL